MACSVVVVAAASIRRHAGPAVSEVMASEGSGMVDLLELVSVLHLPGRIQSAVIVASCSVAWIAGGLVWWLVVWEISK